MLFTWLGRAFFWVLRLFIPRSILPAPPQKLKPINAKDETCPACHNKGQMTVEHVTITTRPGKADAVRANAMLYTCENCKAFFYRKPVYTATLVDGRPIGPDDIHGREVRGISG